MKFELNNKGSTLIELIMVMLLLILFGATISSLIYSGGETQQRIIQEKNSQIDARIALSYLNMSIRQNDRAEKISVEQNPLTGGDSIVIKTRADWGGYDTWIFWADGRMYECLADPDEAPTMMQSVHIANISNFNTRIDENGSIVNTIGYSAGGAEEELTSVIFLRSRQ